MTVENGSKVSPLIGGGEMGELVRTRDWSSTPLGAYADWPQSLRSALSLVLNSKGIAALYWGPEQWLLYNDAYGAALGDRHPAAFGRPMPEVLSDIAPVLGPQVAEVLRTGVGFAIEDVPLTMVRAGRNAESWWTYSFSPIQGESDGFAGVLLLAIETTNQRAQEQADQRQRTRLEVAHRVARLGAFEWDIAAGTVEMDARAREIFALAEHGAIDEAEVFGRMAPEDLARSKAQAEHAAGRFGVADRLLPGKTTDIDYDIILPDGTRRSIASSGTVIEDDAGFRRMLGAVNDVTAFKRTEAQLAAVNATLEQRVTALATERDQLWRLSRDPFLICDLEGRWISASPMWQEILGWRLDELLGRTSVWMEHPDDVARTRQEIVDVGGGEITTAFVNRFRARNGLYRTFSWTAVSEGDRLFCVARDVTDEVARDEALRRYENIVQSDTAPICAFDRDCRLIAFNQAHSNEFFRIYGYRVQVGDVFPDLFLPEQAPVMRAMMERALTGEAFTITEEFGDPDLVVPYWEVTYNPLRDEEGNIVGAFHHALDITDRLRAQSELASTQEALRQAQKMEAVGQLTGGLAHDFNNLLTGMMGNLELLQLRLARGRMDDLDRFILAAQGAGRRAAALTQRLLAFSRRQTLDPRPTDVNRLVSGIEEMLRRTVGPGNTIEVVGATGLWTANIDAGQLENALLNLCINARDAMPDGGRITIETANQWFDKRAARERDISPGAYLSICVTDTGTGMAPEIVDRVFEPFFTTKPLGEGTGLGLSMIYGFARQSNGQVRVDSAMGSGTTICIYLPRHLGDAASSDVAEVEAAAARTTGETILVIDDEATIRHLIDEVLDDAGYTVIGAGDGAAGIKVLQSGARIELLITDVGLPGGMNGRQVADEARRLRPGLRVLFITGYAENAAVGNGHLEPGMELLTKPFTMEALTAKVAGMLERG